MTPSPPAPLHLAPSHLLPARADVAHEVAVTAYSKFRICLLFHLLLFHLLLFLVVGDWACRFLFPPIRLLLLKILPPARKIEAGNPHMAGHVTCIEESYHAYECVMSRIWTCRVTQWTSRHGMYVTCMEQSYHACGCVMSRTFLVTNMNELSRHVMSNVSMSHVTHMNVSCHAYKWVVWHVWMSHVTYMNESCHTYEQVMLQVSCYTFVARRTCRWATSRNEETQAHTPDVMAMFLVWWCHGGVSCVVMWWWCVLCGVWCGGFVCCVAWWCNGSPTTLHTIIHHGVATISRIFKIVGLFCRIQSL